MIMKSRYSLIRICEKHNSRAQCPVPILCWIFHFRISAGKVEEKNMAPTWIPLCTTMQIYCEPYFTAVERWRNYSNHQLLTNRISLIEIADRMLLIVEHMRSLVLRQF